MDAYTRSRAVDFWFEFDDLSLHHRSPELMSAMGASYVALFGGVDLDRLYSELQRSYQIAPDLNEFRELVLKASAGFRELAVFQHSIMEKHFAGDMDALMWAFVDFGQGVLFDQRNVTLGYETQYVHMMDGTPTDWVGYHRWYSAVVAGLISGADPHFWEPISRYIALAWAIQTDADPVIDSNSNPGLPKDRLDILIEYWTNAPLEVVTKAFVSHPKKAPPPEEFPYRVFRHQLLFAAQKTRPYEIIQEILEASVGTAKPTHAGKKKFWNLPISEFLALGKIYGVELIASPGEHRGARSGLVKALKGEPPFDDNGFGRMPRDRPPISDEHIAFIEKWIDDGCLDVVT